MVIQRNFFKKVYLKTVFNAKIVISHFVKYKEVRISDARLIFL